MAFDKTLFSKASSNLTEGFVAVTWAYGPTADNIAAVTASAYFDTVTEELTKSDLIYIVASDANTFRAVTSNTDATPVTVAALA